MNDIQKRFFLFIFGCIVLRIIFAASIKKYPEYAKYVSLFAIFPVIVWLVLYFGSYRKTGPEVFGGTIWWNNLRPFHAFMYLLFIILAFYNKEIAWIPLAIDVSVGFVGFLYYHYQSGNFVKLLN